jgi:hypothetical protein
MKGDDMSFDLHLTVRGLCALVPGEALPDPPNPPLTIPSLQIILLDVRQAPPIDGKNLCAHQPLLHLENPLAQVVLNGDEIEILSADPAQPGVALQTSYWSVASMSRLRPNFTVDAALLSQPPGRNDLVARLTITSARVSGIDPIPLSFATPNPYTGNFAQGVFLKIPIEGDAGSFKVTSYQDGTSRIVNFSPSAEGIPVQAFLSNLCDSDHMVEEDADFLAYYMLEPNLSGPFLGPQPFLASTSPGDIGEIQGQATSPGGGTCIPART